MTVLPLSDRMPDPHVVYQNWLDVASHALLDGDAKTFVEMIHIPFILRTATTENILEDVEDLRLDTQNVTAALKAQQVTHFVRLVKKARYLDEDTIEGWHTTYILRHATSVTPNYGNRMVMRRMDGEWKVCEADHELSSDRLPISILKSKPGSLESAWRHAKQGIKSAQARAEPIYQAFADSLSQANNASDFPSFCEHFVFPHEIHYHDTDHIAQEPDDLRAFFDLMSEQRSTLNASAIIRTARFAEFLSDDRIFGYHDFVMVRDNHVVFGPVRSRMMLILHEGRWACSSVTNSLSQKTPSEPMLNMFERLPTLREIQERMRK